MTSPDLRLPKDVYDRVQAAHLRGRKVRNGTVYPRWIEGSEAFWYERGTDKAPEIRIVDAKTGANRLAFTMEAAAEALGTALDAKLDPNVLILKSLRIEAGQEEALFEAFDRAWRYRFDRGALEETAKAHDSNWTWSPDGKKAVVLRDNNLWLRDTASGEERALTTDGAETYAYGSMPVTARIVMAAFGARAEGCWSPDSKYFLTLQTDDRHVPEMAVLEFVPEEGVRPRVIANPTSLPGDPKVTEFRILAIDVETGRQVEARYPRLTAVRMNDTVFAAGLAWWSADARTAYFVDIERGERAAHLVAFDVASGAARVVFSERADTYVEMGVNVYAPALVFPLPATNELIWYSERSGHGHLYLYDLASGTLKHPITSGPWQIREVQHVDETRREIFFTAAGIAAEEGPYICKPCVVSLDGGDVKILSREPGEHIVWRPGEWGLLGTASEGIDRFAISGLSPSGDYFVETVGSIDRLPKTILRRRDGSEVALVERADGSTLPKDWHWPESVKLKAADGVTDIYGILFKPVGYDPDKSYPLIDFIYGGPQVSYVPRLAFGDGSTARIFCEASGWAELGAFSLVIDARGTAYRERAFREASHGAVHTASNIDDHIAAIKQIAARYPALDLGRIGITGHSGGGYATALAMLCRGDFFKVGVASSGNYDQAFFWHSWGERYHGMLEGDNYKVQAPKTFAADLSGKILFVHGLMDSGCHPGALFQLTQALIEENKDFEMVLLPRAGHPGQGYGVRRGIDFFVRHLFGAAPPDGYRFTSIFDETMKRWNANAKVPSKNAETR